MNGPRHYREAERLVQGYRDGLVAKALPANPGDLLAIAQVHATLALAAAMASAFAVQGAAIEAWQEAINR